MRSTDSDTERKSDNTFVASLFTRQSCWGLAVGVLVWHATTVQSHLDDGITKAEWLVIASGVCFGLCLGYFVENDWIRPCVAGAVIGSLCMLQFDQLDARNKGIIGIPMFGAFLGAAACPFHRWLLNCLRCLKRELWTFRPE